MNKLSIFLSILIALTFSLTGYCIDFYVDSTAGLDGNTGLAPDVPFKTINRALSEAAIQIEHVTIHLAIGTYSMDSGEVFPIEMTGNTTLVGNQLGLVNVDAYGSEASVFSFDGVIDSEIVFLRITGGIGTLLSDPGIPGSGLRAGGGVYIANNSEPKISFCTITENFLFGSEDLGAGIYCSSSMLYIVDSSIDYNIGGGIYFNGSTGTVLSCEISNNSYGGNASGGVFCVNSSPGFFNCTLKDNNMPGFRLSNSAPTITACDITNNSDSGIYATDNSSFQMTRSKITGNSGFIGGGIACLFGSSPFVTNSTILENQASFLGGGIFLYEGSSITLNSCNISGNSSFRGSGIYCENSAPIIRYSYLLSNNNLLPNAAGGGIYCRGDSELTVENTTISTNFAQYGGGIHCFKNKMATISNCLFTKNTASAYGGAIHCVDSATVITNCTIVENTANKAEGGVSINNSDVTVMNCILWNNIGESIGGNVAGNVTYNCIDTPYVGTGNIYDDPLFLAGSRGNYYLSNQLAGQLQNSPCINTGNESVPVYNFGPQIKTTRTDGVFDTDRIDMGYHYPPNIQFALNIVPVKESYTQGDSFDLFENVSGSFKPFNADIYFVLQIPSGEWLYYHSGKWDSTISPVLADVLVMGGSDILGAKIFTITIPNAKPPISDPGMYKFITYAKKPSTDERISTIAEVAFTVGGAIPIN